MQRLKLGLVCLTWLLMASAVSAQMAVDPTSNAGSNAGVANLNAGVANLQNFSGGGVLNGTYFNIRQVIGDGVGWQNSFSQVGLLTPFWLNEDAFIGSNVNLIVTNSQQTGVNAGLLGRQYVYDMDRIFGVYGYYDNDQDAYNYRYNQFTIGAETLGMWWDARANGYFSTGMNSNTMSAIGISGNPFYVGHYIAFAGQEMRDQALSGGDAEVGAPLSPYTQWLRGYAGIYGYQSSTVNTVGFRGRVEANVSSDLSLSVMVTQDALFGTNVNGVIDFKFSGFLPTRYFPNWTTKQRMLNPVQRNWRIATHTYVAQVDVDAINPATGKAYFIDHVNNLAAPGGDGTIEHPFNHLQSDPKADIILVHLGNATTLANAVTGSANLVDNQRLLGTGILSTADMYAQFGGTTINGVYALPQTSNSGLYPYVTNPGGNIVTLANNNEVAGLNLIGSGGSAITNTVAGSKNFNLHNLEIANNAGYGISLTNASGSGIISSINVGTTDHANPNGIGNNTVGGIQISSGAPGLNLQLSNVYMNSSPVNAQAQGIWLSAANGYLNANLNNVFANGNTSTGLQLTETGQNLAVAMNSVETIGNGGVGTQVSGSGGSITITANDLEDTGNGLDNLQIGTQASPVTNSVVNVTLNNSSFSNSLGGSGIVFSGSGTFGTLNLTSSVYGNNQDGLAIYAINSSLMNATVTNSNFVNNGQDAFHVVSDTGSTVNLTVDPTNASGSGNDGLYYNVGQNATFNTTFMNTNLNNSGNSAVYGVMSNFATANLYFNKTTGANSGAGGFALFASNNSVANINIQDGTFQNSGTNSSGAAAVYIHADDSMVTILTDNTTTGQPANFSFGGNISSTGVIGNQAYGLELGIQNNSVFSGTFENGDFSNALSNAVNVGVNSGSNATLTLFNTNGNNSVGGGLVADVDNATLTANFTLSNFNNSSASGNLLQASNGGRLTANFNDSTMNNNFGIGLEAAVTGATSVATVNLTNGSDINSNGYSGLGFDVSGGTLNISDTSNSISNNGVGGSTASGVVGTVTNAGTANLDMQNVTINNNLDNGVFVRANTGGNVNALFNLGSVNGNGVNSPNPTTYNNDGIRLDLNAATNSSLQLTNGVTVNGNGSNGVTILAANGTIFNGSFDSSTIMNNGAASGTSTVIDGAGVNLSSDTNSTLNLTMASMTIDNTASGGTQQYGLLTSSSNSAALNVTLTGGLLSNNALDAVNTTATTSSTTNINFTDVVADNSGANGALFSVQSGAVTSFMDYSSGSTNTASISSSGQSGILVSVDGAGSGANFNLDGLNLNTNGLTFGGQGFFGLATNGGVLNAFIANSSIASNANQGIEINATNTGTIARFNVFNTITTNNGSEGLLINVTDSANVYYRSINSQYTNNGINGGLDGVQINATGTGAANSATAISLFSGDTIDGNFGNGMSLNASNGATLTTSIQNSDISNNSGYGIDISADNNANTQFNLLMSGANTLNNNTLGSFNNLDFNGVNQVVLELSGTFSNPTGDGVHIDIENVTNAAVALSGPGTIDNSGGNGIFVNMENVTNGSLLIDGFTEINNSLLNGIDVTFNNVASGAIEVDGTTNINNSGDNAVDISLTNGTALVNNLAYGGANIQVLTLTNNYTPASDPTLAPALYNALPDPVTVPLSGLGITPANALTVNGITAAGSGINGIDITATGASTIAANGSFITNNTISGSATGDGILVNLTGSTADGMTIAGNSLSGNDLNGLNVVLATTPVTGMTISGNNISTNNLDGIRFDLSSSSLSNLTLGFNTITGNGVTGSGNGVEFTNTTGAVQNSDLTNVVFNTNNISSNKGDGVRLVSPIGATAAPVWMVFDTNTISSNTGTGVNFNLIAGSQSLKTTFSGNTISSNSGGPGINVQLNNNANFSSGFANNTISNNGAQGINIVTQTAGVVTTNFYDNTINGNAGDGITVTLGNAGQFNALGFWGNTISNNTGLGVDLTTPGASSFTWNLGDISQASNIISGNAGAGVGILMTGSSTGTLVIENTAMENTTAGTNPLYNGEGLAVIQQGSSILQGAIVASAFTGNAGDGAYFSVTGNELGVFATLENFNIGNYSSSSLGNTFSNNTGNGLDIIRTADGEIGSAGTPIEIGWNTFSNNGQNGIFLSALNKFQTDYYNINNNLMSSNAQNGLKIDVEADANMSVDMQQNTIVSNTLNGILMVNAANAGSDERALTGTWIQNTIESNKADGIDLTGPLNGLIIGDPTDTTFTYANVIASNTLNGIESTGPGTATIGDNVITLNGTNSFLNTANENAGIMLNILGTNQYTIVNNMITNNFGDGVQYQINQGFTGFTGTVFIDGNYITNNSGRGINMINRDNSFAYFDISNNQVAANGLEGVYVVNTASTDQAIWASSTTPLLADGAVTATPFMALHVVGNSIIGNGANSTLQGTGLVVRVGTAQSIHTTNGSFAGGFAQTSAATIGVNTDATTFFNTIVANINANGGYADQTSTYTAGGAYAGVIAEVDGNSLGGNFGNDIVFNSFVSTVAPPTSTGTWTNTTPPTVPAFNPTSVWSDPLSRFDLYFRNNTTDAGSFDPLGQSLGGYGAVNPALVAFYNNSEPIFKSATNINVTNPATPPPNPFFSATRDRNATRQAASAAVLTAQTGFTLPPGQSPPFLFPGLGASTWRVSTDSVGAGANTNATFIQGNNVNNVSQPYGAGDYLGGSVVPDETSYIFGEF